MAGLRRKYRVTKADGTPADRNGMFFVLKLNSSNRAHARASQAAVLVYAEMVEDDIPRLAADLRSTVMQLRRDGESVLWDGSVKLPPLTSLYHRALNIIAGGCLAHDIMSTLARNVLNNRTGLLETLEAEQEE